MASAKILLHLAFVISAGSAATDLKASINRIDDNETESQPQDLNSSETKRSLTILDKPYDRQWSDGYYPNNYYPSSGYPLSRYPSTNFYPSTGYPYYNDYPNRYPNQIYPSKFDPNYWFNKIGNFLPNNPIIPPQIGGGTNCIGRDCYRYYPGYQRYPGVYPTSNYPGYSGYSSTGYSTTGYPTSGYSSSGYPSSGYPSSGYPSSGYPSSGYPSSGYPSTHFPSGYTTTGYQSNYPTSTISPNYPIVSTTPIYPNVGAGLPFRPTGNGGYGGYDGNGGLRSYSGYDSYNSGSIPGNIGFGYQNTRYFNDRPGVFQPSGVGAGLRQPTPVITTPLSVSKEAK